RVNGLPVLAFQRRYSLGHADRRAPVAFKNPMGSLFAYSDPNRRYDRRNEKTRRLHDYVDDGLSISNPFLVFENLEADRFQALDGEIAPLDAFARHQLFPVRTEERPDHGSHDRGGFVIFRLFARLALFGEGHLHFSVLERCFSEIAHLLLL